LHERATDRLAHTLGKQQHRHGNCTCFAKQCARPENPQHREKVRGACLRQVRLHLLRKLRPIVAFFHVVQLLKEARRPLVEQADEVDRNLREGAQEEAKDADDVQVDRHGLEHARALHLHRDLLACTRAGAL
jgi:hypothetical protein